MLTNHSLAIPAPAAEADTRHPLIRLSWLLDAGTLAPLHDDDGSGVRAARGTIDGAEVLAYCTDARTMGGAMTAAGCRHIVAAIEAAAREARPVVGLLHSGGASLADGVEALHGVGRVFAAMIRASGRIAQISVVLGPAAGGAAYGPALTDLVIMSSAGRVFVTGPDVVRAVTGEQIDMEGLGGPHAHSRKSGVAHMVTGSETEALAQARRVTSFFARPGRFELAEAGSGKDLRALLPERARRAYDVRPLIREILDPGDGHGHDGFAELQAQWAPNIVVGMGRLCGRSIGVIANNPLRKCGCLDALSADKAARFVRMCDALGVPLLVLADVPGYLPGVAQEWDGVVRRGAKLLHAFAEATVPRATLITRKSYGGAYIAMNSRALGASAVFAWPGAEVAVMGAEAAVGILHRKRLAAAAEHELPALREQLVEQHRQQAGGMERAVGLGLVDEVIAPAQTRRKVAQALAGAPERRGAHGNIPL